MQILFIFQLLQNFYKLPVTVPAHPAAQHLPAALSFCIITSNTRRARHPTGGAGDSPPAPVSISQVDVRTAAVRTGVHD